MAQITSSNEWTALAKLWLYTKQSQHKNVIGFSSIRLTINVHLENDFVNMEKKTTWLINGLWCWKKAQCLQFESNLVSPSQTVNSWLISAKLAWQLLENLGSNHKHTSYSRCLRVILQQLIRPKSVLLSIKTTSDPETVTWHTNVSHVHGKYFTCPSWKQPTDNNGQRRPVVAITLLHYQWSHWVKVQYFQMVLVACDAYHLVLHTTVSPAKASQK